MKLKLLLLAFAPCLAGLFLPLARVAPVVLVPAFVAGCASHATPESIVYETLRQAGNALDAKMALYLAEVKAGKVSDAKQVEVDAAYTRANNSIVAAARVAKAGLEASTPEETARLVRAVVDLITLIVPPSGLSPDGQKPKP